MCGRCVSTKYAWVKHLRDKKVKTVLNGFIKTVNVSNRKPNNLLIDLKEDNFIIILCKNGWTIMIFLCNRQIMNVSQYLLTGLKNIKG